MDLYFDHSQIDEFEPALEAGRRVEYVYMYPPRQTYRAFGAEVDVAASISESLASRPQVNLYAHVPICAQICHFCNLFTSTRRDDGFIDDYISALGREIELYRDLLHPTCSIESIYLGGGTPTVVPPEMLGQVLGALEGLPGILKPDIEIAIEIDPATVGRADLMDLRSIGINRINLGYQSTSSDEVLQLGRRNLDLRPVSFIEDALGVGFDNVCIDLIYGLKGQTSESWRQSLIAVAKLAPQTVCAYALTSRPHTGYSKAQFQGFGDDQLYAHYDVACEVLDDYGYDQETPVRWIKPGGGYQQKANHWSLQNLLGVGAGSRSYLWEIDTRNGYSIVDRNSTVDRYLSTVAAGSLPVTDGFVMTDDERLRKAAILGINHLSREDLATLIGRDPVVEFRQEFDLLASLGLCEISPDRAKLTRSGYRHRDLIAQLFFSDQVIERLRGFDYLE